MDDNAISAPAPAVKKTVVAPADEKAPKTNVVADSDDGAVTVESIVRGWLLDNLGNSPVSRDTAVWNHIQDAVPELVARLSAI